MAAPVPVNIGDHVVLSTNKISPKFLCEVYHDHHCAGRLCVFGVKKSWSAIFSYFYSCTMDYVKHTNTLLVHGSYNPQFRSLPKCNINKAKTFKLNIKQLLLRDLKRPPLSPVFSLPFSVYSFS